MFFTNELKPSTSLFSESSCSMKKTWLFKVSRGLYYPSYIGIILNHCKASPSIRLAGERKDLYSWAGNDNERSPMNYLGFNAIIFVEVV